MSSSKKERDLVAVEKMINELSKDPYKWAQDVPVKTLVGVLRAFSKAYTEGNELISDEIYDILKEVLEDRDPNNEFLGEVGAPVHGVKVMLPYPMRSLDKIKPGSPMLSKWLKNNTASHEKVSDKLDGISAMINKSSKGVAMYTRGDGEKGQDVTHLLTNVVSKKTLSKMEDDMAVRGELIITKKDFAKLKNKYPDMKNARNTVAGLANSKSMDERRTEILKVLHFVAYHVYVPVLKPDEQMKLLEKCGFEVVWYKMFKREKVNEDGLNEILVTRRDECPYEIDGIVVTDNVIEETPRVGNPVASFAFKSTLLQQMVETRVEDVVYNISKDRYLKPTVLIEAVDLDGVTIRQATAFNAKWIMDNKIAKGAIIFLIRSGGVIPYIVSVKKPAKAAKLPDGDWEWGETGVDIIGTGPTWERELKLRRMLHFFETIEVAGMSRGTLAKLYAAGFDNIKKIMRASPEDWEEIDGLGKKSATKLHAAIKTSLENLTLSKIMVASQMFGRGFAERKIGMILKKYPNITTWDLKERTDAVELIDDIPGFDLTTAKRFVEGLPAFQKFMKSMGHLLPKLKGPAKQVGNRFAGQNIVFTGFRDAELAKYIEAQGGSVKGSVSKNTTLVVYKGDAKSKLNKAMELGIKVIEVEAFRKSLGARV
jgi:NAD-dependent DNA ligase